jgi:hypothetical protein
MLPRDGARYLGMNIDWDYIIKNIHVSLLDYVPEALIGFQHTPMAKPQHQLYPHVKLVYSATKQYAEAIDKSPPLSKEDKKYVQEVVGTFLYYAQCVNSTMLTALGSIATQQANPTKNTMIKVKQFLDYAFTHPNATVTYQASDMVLAAHSDASYLSEANACSQAGRNFFMSSNTPCPHNNGAVLLSPKSSRQSYPWQPRPKSELSTSTVGKQSLLATPWNSWANPNLPHQFKLTTQWC